MKNISLSPPLKCQRFSLAITEIIQVENLYNSMNNVFRSGITHDIHVNDIHKVKNTPVGLDIYNSPGFFGSGDTQ
jgi:hypothetical protein